MLREDEAEARKVAYNGLLLIPHVEEHLPYLLVGLEDPVFWIGVQSQRALLEWPLPEEGNPDPVFGGVLRAFSHFSAGTATQMIEVLAQRGAKNLDALFITGVERGSDELKAAVLDSAQRHRSQSITRQASDLLLLPGGSELKIAALRYLGYCQHKPSLTAMVKYLSSSDPKLREASAIALRMATGQLFGHDEQAWTRWIESTASN
jgi:hypothetical protein